MVGCNLNANVQQLQQIFLKQKEIFLYNGLHVSHVLDFLRYFY